MSNDAVFTTIILVGAAVVLAVFYSGMKKRQREHKAEVERVARALSTKSPFLLDVKAYNESHPVNMGVRHIYRQKFIAGSKPVFDNFNYDKHIIEIVSADIEWHKEIYRKCMENRENVPGLIDLLNSYEDYDVPDEILSELGTDIETYREAEKGLIEYMKKFRYETSPDFIYECFYITPKGTKSYSHHKQCNIYDIAAYIKRAESLQEYKQTKQYQRARITPSVRLKVIKADQAKCCLCGRMAADGAVLEVDHFVPVANGGTSDLDNLWTLCHDCNSGKSDMEPDELQEAFDRAIANRA